MKKYEPYSYIIGWTALDRWYYGIEYGIKKVANPYNIWKTYFTSSKIVLRFREMHGEPDVIQVRRTFNNASTCIDWELKVLTRMKVLDDDRFLNANISPGIKLRDPNSPNPMSDPRIRNKMINTKLRRNIINFFISGRYNNIEYRNTKSLKNRLVIYIEYIKATGKPFRYTLGFLDEALLKCINYIPVGYPKNRKSGKRGKVPNISASKKLKENHWYHHEVTLENICVTEHNVPDGYIKGMYKRIKPIPPHTEYTKEEWVNKMKLYRQNESEEKKNIRLRKFNETIKNRKNK